MVHQQFEIAGQLTTVLPSIDFESYSEAGYRFDHDSRTWENLGGIGAVGAAAYAEHPSTEVLCMAWNLQDGEGDHLWLPGDPPPQELFDYILNGGIIEAWKCTFEYFMWKHVCVKKLGWVPLPYDQLFDAAAKAQAGSLPGGLGKCADITRVTEQKMTEGKRLIQKFSVPKNPSAKDPTLRNVPGYEPQLSLFEDGIQLTPDTKLFYDYCIQDIRTQTAIGRTFPDLSPFETEVFLMSQRINLRGVHIDMPGVEACADIVHQARKKYVSELIQITGGAVNSPDEHDKMRAWLTDVANVSGVTSLDKEHVAELLERKDLPPNARRVVEIRKLLGSAAVKKLYAIRDRTSNDHRLRDQYAYCGAKRTGRFAAYGAQLHNFPADGARVYKCGNCRYHFGAHNTACVWCLAPAPEDTVEWNPEAAEQVLACIMERDLTKLEACYGDPLKAVSGVLRSLIMAEPGREYISSDFNSIEAVIIAVIAGEQWRIDVFNTHGMIYEESASRITGIPFQEFLDHKERTGEHHPMRKKVGKVAELGSGFGGGHSAWCNFGADKLFDSKEDIVAAIKEWRKASPMIVKLWYGLEECAQNCILSPGTTHSYRGIHFQVIEEIMYITLPSGRRLAYREPKLEPDNKLQWGDNESFSDNEYLLEHVGYAYMREIESQALFTLKTGQTATHKGTTTFIVNGILYLNLPSGVQIDFPMPRVWERFRIMYMGWNSVASKGAIGWTWLDTYGGKLTENVVQAIARDIMVHGMLNLDRAGYFVTMHTHDEPLSDVREGFGSIEEYERLMTDLPAYTRDGSMMNGTWPIKATGGWRGKRNRKD